ncbi:MAG: methylated-DNA--[protein]-cysteine S-methyltransferase [Planctomycetes bacterium]|nr:methylated-DNA--[protein]-cysteine S-methyltransferase [Planctomycetota bacterium]
MSFRDYARIEQAIHFLHANRLSRPSLAEVAAHIGVSPPYLQRVFRRWAGVSPNTLLRMLSVEHAKRLLRESRSVLDATYDAGVSSSGRLHDHFVTLEAITPGEYKSGGAGVEIACGVHDSPFGACFVATTRRGVCRLAFLREETAEYALHELRREWPRAAIREDASITADWVRRIFESGDREAASLPLLVKGTNFQVQVWRALLQIPEGAVATYRGIAAAIGRPQASRAVGQAVGDNPIAYLIPCHRVLRQAGDLGGYRWGVPRKTAMLAWEAAKTEVATARLVH